MNTLSGGAAPEALTAGMPMFGRKKPRRTGAAITTKRQAGQMLGGSTARALAEYEDHRSQFLRCSRSMSRLDVEVMTDDPVDLGGFLETLGLSENYSALAEEFELQDLQSLAKKDAAACLSELEKAGVLSGGHRVKITNALIDLPENRSRAPLPRPQPAAKDVFDPPHAGVEEEEEKTPPFFC